MKYEEGVVMDGILSITVTLVFCLGSFLVGV